jgi:hypothetical protein
VKHTRIGYLLVLSLCLALLVSALAIPTSAAGEGSIGVYPGEGKIGDVITISGGGFEASKTVYIYLSSREVGVGSDIDRTSAYELVVKTATDEDGSFIISPFFLVPDKLTGGKVKEDVHGGGYYVYVTYSNSDEIVAMAHFTVLDGEIELDPEEGMVGTEVEISGEGLRPNQKIGVEYEEEAVDIISGDRETDSKGKCICTIIIPESPAGENTIAVVDESGDSPSAEFSVKPRITLEPPEQAAGKEVTINGTGFRKKELITITVDGSRTSTTPLSIYTNRDGSFSASFLVPFYYGGVSSKVVASDVYLNSASAQFTVLAGLILDPITSPTSPGHVGMELTVRGASFTIGAPVNITYTNNDESIPVATATVDANGNFEVKFAVPPSVAGDHTITATDGTSTLTSAFTMESKSPPVPLLLMPRVTAPAEAEAHFDWEDVTDPSGVSYTLQVASDADFTAIVLEREGLTDSEYTLAKGEKLESTGQKAYYWRVKAVDGASNESEWAFPWLFYVGSSGTSLSGWVWYIFYGLGALLVGIIILWLLRWRRR